MANKLINRIYKSYNALPAAHGILRDDNWSNVYAILDTIGEHGTVDILSTAYDGMEAKTWNITVTAPDGTFAEGYLKAMFCGTMDNPTSAYDVCLILW